MEGYQKELKRIKTILKENPKGMTVTDISREMHTNRNSVAKYLDILLISGHAEMVTFGPAKVFFPSRRVPISNVINFISDCVLVLDEFLNILQVNDTFLDFLDIHREVLINADFEKNILPLFPKKSFLTNLKEAIEGKEFSDEMRFSTKENYFFFKIRLIPTIFENGRQGVTIILTDVTEKKRIESALRGGFKNLRNKKLITNK